MIKNFKKLNRIPWTYHSEKWTRPTVVFSKPKHESIPASLDYWFCVCFWLGKKCHILCFFWWGYSAVWRAVSQIMIYKIKWKYSRFLKTKSQDEKWIKAIHWEWDCILDTNNTVVHVKIIFQVCDILLLDQLVLLIVVFCCVLWLEKDFFLFWLKSSPMLSIFCECCLFHPHLDLHYLMLPKSFFLKIND